MKQLQNNFTTPEQSKRLLELGVPAWSADTQIPYIEYYDISPSDGEKIVVFSEILSPIIWDEAERGILPKVKKEWTREFASEKYDGHFTEYIPCWSVGRLIEIIYKCDKLKVSIVLRDVIPSKSTIIENLIDILEYAIKLNDIDFSKLEE